MAVKMKTMTKEQKELLIKDICARLPYGIKAQDYEDESPYIIIGYEDSYFSDNDGRVHRWDNIKPHLFPLSSITKEQRDEFPFELSLLNAFINGHISLFEDEELSVDDITRMMDCLNRKHIDYRGLIPMGLAVDATGKNIY